MADYQSILAPPVTSPTSQATPNTVTYSGTAYPAIVGDFSLSPVLGPGGFSPHLVAEAIIQKSALPNTVNFRKGESVLVNQVGGSSRACRISAVQDVFTEYRLTLIDANESA